VPWSTKASIGWNPNPLEVLCRVLPFRVRSDQGGVEIDHDLALLIGERFAR